MVSNIHNAFISRFYNDVDLQLFFSGFTLNSNISITDAISIFEDKSPYDIEYVELLSPYCKNELEIISFQIILSEENQQSQCLMTF